jgi:hypothetical protein
VDLWGQACLIRGGVRVLVVAPVFKTGEAESLDLAGSIPVHLRHTARGRLVARRHLIWTAHLARPTGLNIFLSVDKRHALDIALSALTIS